MNKNLVLFDFDGTLTSKDSFLAFIRFYVGPFRYLLGFLFLFPILLLYKAGLIKNWRAKEIVFTWFFKDESLDQFDRKCFEFCTDHLKQLLKSEAMSALCDHISNGDRVVIVSASFENYLLPWCRALNVELVATRATVLNNRLTGKINGKNCYGEEKVNRLKKLLDLKSYDDIYVYGDSKSDRPMMALGNHKFYRTF
jgi:phosphatidylglycerophosphatase C